MVNIKWWRTIRVPVLVKRFIKGKSPYEGEGDFISEKLSEIKKYWELIKAN
jgi:hypothetical protein